MAQDNPDVDMIVCVRVHVCFLFSQRHKPVGCNHRLGHRQTLVVSTAGEGELSVKRNLEYRY